ncbi:SPOR domain-containing protein [Solidesulfovibrio alcoholivorans]|uniref:SPOR domain-containing protein n=1 Tax=Solidesulfovibrio alcoholivorans TaxID=81406 RepID=UPI0004970EEA|nr:hypothetical protein [Solidesulfovibrio alcoholivorans]
MRLATTLCVLAALCLSGCAADKSFEKEILGHPAPESSTDTGWSRTPPPPPPPPRQTPPAAPAYAPAPAPSAAAPAPVPATVPAPASGSVPSTSPASRPPAGADYTPKPFTPAPAAQPAVEKPGAALFEQQAQQPAPEPAPQAVSTAAPAPQHAAVPGDQSYLTFQVGEFAHAASGKQLMAILEAKGFSTRMDQGKRNNKPFYTVSAGKAGSRAMLEAELLGAGVTEPRLVSERPAGTKAPAAASAPAAAPAPKAQPAAAPKVSAPIAPPIVEPAPPLPDGYVPPPKKTGS